MFVSLLLGTFTRYEYSFKSKIIHEIQLMFYNLDRLTDIAYKT